MMCRVVSVALFAHDLIEVNGGQQCIMALHYGAALFKINAADSSYTCPAVFKWLGDLIK